jgi:probable O-glycosylation ligase (exosortase A-associated)
VLRTLIVFLILIPGIGAALFSRFAALLLYFWFALFRPQEWVWWDISSLRLSLVLGVLFVVPALLTGTFPYLAHPISLAALVFLVTGLVAQLNAFEPSIGWYWLDYLWRLLLVCLMAIPLLSDQRRFRIGLAVVAGSFGVHGAKAGLLSLLSGGIRYAEGFGGAFGDNNGYAVGLAMVAPLLLAAGQTMDQRWLRRTFMWAAPCCLFAVISTFSRGGFLAVVASALTLTMLQRRRGVALILMLVLAIPVGFFMVSQQGYVDRLKTIRTYEEADESSALSRLHFWRVATRIAADHPLGIGLFNFESAYDRYDDTGGVYGTRRSVHSSHFQALAETGYLGFVAFESVLIFTGLAALRIRRRGMRSDIDPVNARLFLAAGNGLLASTAAFVVGGAFVAMALNDLLWIELALITSLDLISRRVCREADARSTVMPATPQVSRYMGTAAQGAWA